VHAHQGTVLTVSHDRYFLRKIATRVLELRDGNMQDYTGDYECACENALVASWLSCWLTCCAHVPRASHNRLPVKERGRGGPGGGCRGQGGGAGQEPDRGQEQDVQGGEDAGQEGEGASSRAFARLLPVTYEMHCGARFLC
jgi:hypothetical protein